MTAKERDPKSPKNATAAAKKAVTFKRLYESRDRRLCLFEDEHGHVTAVNAKRLA